MGAPRPELRLGCEMNFPIPGRWLLAAAAILSGTCVSAALLVYANPEAGTSELYVAAHDLPAGAPLGSPSVRLQRMRPEIPARLVFGRGSERELTRSRAGHDLSAGQLIQRSDLGAAAEAADRRLVLIGIKDVPAASPGDRVDLLLVSGAGERTSIVPFALGVPVRAVQGGALVLSVPSRQASAFVYAGANLRLAAVLVEPGAGRGQETPISSPEQAQEAVRQ